MIIAGNALLALLSPPPDLQGTREEGDGFGALLTEIESHLASIPDQEEAERRVLESVLQVLTSMFQSYTPATLLSADPAPGTGESDQVSMPPVGERPLGLPPGRGLMPALGATGEVDLPSGMVLDGAQNIGPLAFPALDDQSPGLSPMLAGAPEHFSWLLHRQEHLQDLSGFCMARPTAAWSVSTPTAGCDLPPGMVPPVTPLTCSSASVLATAEVQHVSPGFLRISLATAGAEITTTSSLVGPVEAPPVPLPIISQTELDTMLDARGTIALASEHASILGPDTSPDSRHLPEPQGQAAEPVSSVALGATDSALPLSSARATLHAPSAEPTSSALPSHALEDMGRPWPYHLPVHTVVLQLEPRELGALLLQVRLHDRRLIASFQAQSPEAETLLRAHLPSLHESLSQHGFEVQPIVITRVAEGFSTHMGAGTGAFAHQHSAFQAFAEDQQAASARETSSEVDLHRTLRRTTEQRRRLLDVVI